MNNEELIIFMNWVSKNWSPDNGVGYWVPSDDIYLTQNQLDEESITTEELIEIFYKTYYKPIQRDKKLSKILDK